LKKRRRKQKASKQARKRANEQASKQASKQASQVSSFRTKDSVVLSLGLLPPSVSVLYQESTVKSGQDPIIGCFL
jgi:hypothetical protein